MAFFTNAAIFLILACVSHQLALSFSNTVRKPRPTRSLQPIKGKTLTKDKAHCTWAVTGDQRAFTMGVTCSKAGKRTSCDYMARPSLCPEFALNPKLYWKQIARSLRKQKSICQDRSALVRAGMCRRAPREAHFKMGGSDRRPRPNVTLTPPPVQSCQPANQRLALEFCQERWTSICTFLFTVVKDQDC
ncbi:unnamed protein product [Knipowitschia caucasica]|uniref:Uncharacterized protein n=1 Tax=Knipowitschia caucasica TaxID=637954 RepID=A0AAV2MHR0_KNICA